MNDRVVPGTNHLMLTETEGQRIGKIDTESKRYMEDNAHFADVLNYLIYDGKPVIHPENLSPLDTTEIAVPYGNGARVPIQKYRDTLKIWAAMSDNKVVYVLLGGEIQNKVHYAMPVRDMLYDGVNYASQVNEANRTYKGKKDEGEISFEDDKVTIKLTNEEFLSGFRKGDKLIPVVTAVIYFGAEEWDGPTTLHEMMSFPDERIKSVVPDYFINVIVPRDISDDAFTDKFHTGLGLAFHVIKYQKDKAVEILKSTNHKRIDRASAEFIKEVLNFDLEFEESEEEGGVDVCKAVEDYTLKERVLSLIEYLKRKGNSNDEIVSEIISQYKVSETYVRKLLAA